MKTLNSLEMARLSPASFAMYASEGTWKLSKHLSLINRKLMDAAAGRITRLIINMPPRPQSINTKVLLDDGSYRLLKDIKIGDNVVTHLGNIKRVNKIILAGKLPVLKITTFGNRVTVANHEHPYFTTSGWIKTKDLKPGMSLGLLSKYPFKNTCHREIEQYRLLGYFIGDGCVTNNSALITNKNPEVIEDIKHCANVLGFRVKDTDRKSVNYLSLSKGVRPWLREIGIANKNSYEKVVPDFVFKTSDDKIAAFLAAYFMCDGSVSKKDETRKSVTVEFYSVSLELLKGCQSLLLRLGINSRIRIKKSIYKDAPYISYRLALSDQDSVTKFYEKIPIYSYKKNNIEDHHYFRQKFDSIYLEDKIEKIEDIGEEECICLEVADDHSYISDDIITHNSGKSFLVSKHFPAWYLGTYPDKNIILTGYEASFAADWGRAARDLFSEYGKELWNLELDDAANAASRWKIKGHSGTMFSVGAGGALLGRGGNIIIVDDPIKGSEDAQSPLFRQKLIDWFGSVLYTRCQPGGSIVIIHQRFHHQDLTGYLLDQMKKGGEKWEWINLPAIALNDEFTESEGGFWPDKLGGRKKGEALWPEMWPIEKLLEMKNSGAISSYYWSALYDQNPVPAEGGMFKEPWFKYAQYKNGYYYLQKNRDSDNVELFDEKDCWKFITADVANKSGKINDYSVIAVWAVTPKNDIVLQHIERDHFGYEQVLKKLIFLNGQFKPRFIGIENTGIAIQMIVEARNKGLAVRALEPEGQGKQNRANSPLGAVVRMESGKIYFLKGITHLSDFEQELLYFPMGKNDDCVDCLSYACNELTKVSGMMSGNFVPYSVSDVITRAGSMKNLWQFGDSGYNF